jgi:hypothetical protein
VNSRASLPVALGEDIGGVPTVVDLARMPHLLVAGTTGSGKSVGVNAMILSLLYRHTPEQVRFILIDPKKLEFTVYEGIPHLLAPVITKAPEAVNALKWAVREMENRYELMSKAGVRNLAGFNEKAAKYRAAGEDLVRKVQTGLDERGKPSVRNRSPADRPYPADRRRHRRDVGPDGRRRQGNRRLPAAPRPDGPRRRHPPDHRHAASVRGRHHRHDQGELPDPYLLHGHQQGRQPHDPQRAGRRTAPRTRRPSVPGARQENPAPARPLRLR